MLNLKTVTHVLLVGQKNCKDISQIINKWLKMEPEFVFAVE